MAPPNLLDDLSLSRDSPVEGKREPPYFWLHGAHVERMKGTSSPVIFYRTVKH